MKVIFIFIATCQAHRCSRILVTFAALEHLKAMQATEEQGQSDSELVARVLAGETALFELFMRRHNQMVYRAVRAILRDEAEVEDAMQQAYLAAFEHLKNFRGEAKMSTWLVRIAVNEALGRLRRRRPLSSVDGQDELADDAQSPEEAHMTRELCSVLERSIDELNENARVVLVLRELEEMSTAEVAAVLGIAEDAVKTRLHRARTQLQDKVLGKLVGAKSGVFGFEAPRCNRVTAAVMSVLLQRTA